MCQSSARRLRPVAAQSRTVDRVFDQMVARVDATEDLRSLRALEAEIRQGLAHDLRVLVPASALLLALTVFGFCRSLFAAAMPLVVAALTLLWTFGATDFVPHLHVASGTAVAPHLKDTPIWLVDRIEQAPHREALLNLGDELVPGFESFERLIEIVPADEAPKQFARQRWKHYADRGYPLERHEASA